jgi:type IV secretory pathway VirB10-like protein
VEQPPREDARAAMRLRGDLPRVTRLSRKVLVGIGAVVTLGLGGVLIYALHTNTGGSARELLSTGARNIADGLSALPADYTGIPKLGPPLPGDLGRPILNAENGNLSLPLAAPLGGADNQRQQQETEAARVSKLFTGASAARQAPAAAEAGARSAAPNALKQPNLAQLGLAPQPATPTAQDRQAAFLNAAVDHRTVSDERIAPPASPYVLQAGAIIPGALITGIRSDLPGQVTAQVTENVYDSPTGHYLLIPQGTRIIGQYDNDVGFDQSRVLLVWNRLIFPNGNSIVLERQPGADTEGYAGLEDGVDYHLWDLAKAAGLSTLLSVGAELAVDDNNTLLGALRNGFQGTINDAGQQIVRQQLNVQPTLTIEPGFPVRVIVTRDLVLAPYGG